MKWLMLIPMAIFLLACEKQGPMENAGEKIDEAVEDVRAAGETAGDKIEDAVDEVKQDVADEEDEDDPN